MRTFVVLAATGLLMGSALAQQAAAPAQQQQFVPFTVKEADARQMRQWLDEQPMKFGLPVLQWLDQMEAREISRIKKEAADAKAAAEHNQQLEENQKANTPSSGSTGQ
jgi:hypothetical protein